MRIGIVTHAYYPHFGGVTENVAGVSRVLRDLGHQVIVITAGERWLNGDRRPNDERWITLERRTGERWITGEVDVVRIGRQCLVPWNGATVNFTYGVGLSDQLREIYRRYRIELLHIHCPLAPMLPLSALRAANGQPVVGMFHASARSNLGYQLFRRALARDFARITVPVAVSDPARRFVARYFPAHYRLVPNGVDLERFTPDVPPAVASDGRPTILAMGRLDPRKGLEHLIDALPRVARAIGPVRLLVAGEGPLGDQLRARARRVAPGLVDFLGAVPAGDVPGLYTAANCLCAPAVRNESFGIVLLEAMAAARPVVASDISGYRLVVAHGRSGHLVRPADPAALADALIAVLGDRAHGCALGRAGRQQAQLYSWERVTGELLGVYEQALEASGSATGVPGPGPSPPPRPPALDRRGERELAVVNRVADRR